MAVLQYVSQLGHCPTDYFNEGIRKDSIYEHESTTSRDPHNVPFWIIN